MSEDDFYQALQIGIITGIAGGLLTSIIIYFLTRILNDIISPWFQVIFYNAIDLSGQWEADINYQSGRKEKLKYTITQKANKVEIILQIVSESSVTNSQKLITYTMRGVIRDRFIQIYGENINKKSLGVNIALLQVVNGDTLEGKEVYYSRDTSTIVSYDITWKRL